MQVKRDRKSSLAGNTSFIFPGRRVASAVHNRRWVGVIKSSCHRHHHKKSGQTPLCANKWSGVWGRRPGIRGEHSLWETGNCHPRHYNHWPLSSSGPIWGRSGQVCLQIQWMTSRMFQASYIRLILFFSNGSLCSCHSMVMWQWHQASNMRSFLFTLLLHFSGFLKVTSQYQGCFKYQT